MGAPLAFGNAGQSLEHTATNLVLSHCIDTVAHSLSYLSLAAMRYIACPVDTHTGQLSYCILLLFCFLSFLCLLWPCFSLSAPFCTGSGGARDFNFTGSSNPSERSEHVRTLKDYVVLVEILQHQQPSAAANSGSNFTSSPSYKQATVLVVSNLRVLCVTVNRDSSGR